MSSAEYAQKCADDVAALWAPIEQMRHEMQQRLNGFIATEPPLYEGGRADVVLIDRVVFRFGKWWLEGPTPTKDGWHSRTRGSIHAGSPRLEISRRVA